MQHILIKWKLKKYYIKSKVIYENNNWSFSENANSLFLLSETHPLLVTFTWVPANMINVLVTEQYTKGCWRCLCMYLYLHNSILSLILTETRFFPLLHSLPKRPTNGNPCWKFGSRALYVLVCGSSRTQMCSLEPVCCKKPQKKFLTSYWFAD